MHIVSSLGGSGSTYLYRHLHRTNFLFPSMYKVVITLESKYRLPLRRLLGVLRLHRDTLRILQRPDTFYSDSAHNTISHHDVSYEASAEGLAAQARYIIEMRRLRSGSIAIPPAELDTSSLLSLARSYIQAMEHVERASNFEIAMLCNHWGEIGVLKELHLPTLYLIRDPINSIISYSKEERHKEEFINMGHTDINTREWVDAFLDGPLAFWIRHAENALSHGNSCIIRYNNLRDDWLRHARGLPDITADFRVSHNDAKRYFSDDIIEYIDARTSALWEHVNQRNAQ